MCEFCEDIPEWDSIKSYADNKDLSDYYLVKMNNKYCLYQNSKYADFTEVALDGIKFCPYCGKSFEEEEDIITADVTAIELDDADNIIFHYREPIAAKNLDTVIMASDIGEKIYNLIKEKKK